MSRVVCIVDSSTGELIDVGGNARERGRYKRFAKRILSTDKNPTLDYGGNGGDTLTIASNGDVGKKIVLKAEDVEISGDLKIGRDKKTVAEIASGQGEGVLEKIKGTVDQVSVTKDIASGDLTISLDPSIDGKFAMIQDAADRLSKIVTKIELGNLVSGIDVQDDDTLEDVIATLKILFKRLKKLSN